jgi:hypothetical protein
MDCIDARIRCNPRGNSLVILNDAEDEDDADTVDFLFFKDD